MAGRPNILDPKTALEKAMLLFWEKGYTETSIAHLEEALGARRQSIYHAFGDKKSLFIKAYQHYLDTRLSAALNLLKVEGTPQEKLRHFFESSLDCNEEKHFGCFIGNTLATPAAQQEEVNQLTERAVQVFVAALVETLKPLYSDEKKCETVAWSFFTLFQGAQILAKQPGTRESLLHGIELFIDGLG